MGVTQVNHGHVHIKTPEYVSLQFQPAGLGSRTVAFLIDQIILWAISALVILSLVFVMNADMKIIGNGITSWPVAIAIISLFILHWGYFFVLEYFSGGRTIGKKIIGIRVIQDNGHSLTLLSSFIRNFFRIIDSLPTNYLVGILMIYFHPKHKRVGDLVAGSIVIHERNQKRTKKTSAIEKEIEARGLTKEELEMEDLMISSLGTKEWTLLKTYKNRFSQLPLAEREQLTLKISEILLPKVGLQVGNMNEEELENTLLRLYLVMKEDWEYDL